ncbi:MAG: endonuclease III, partial [Casimicrobiaceae bacterium]
MNPQKRRAIFERLRAADPHPQSELEHHSPFELLVAVVLSAQATDKGVNKATAKLFPVARTPAAIVQLGVDGLIPYVQSIGLFRNKAKNIVALSEILLRDHGGEVPAKREALEALPGVGRKTANVVLNVAFGEPTIAVDTHIFRVAN